MKREREREKKEGEGEKKERERRKRGRERGENWNPNERRIVSMETFPLLFSASLFSASPCISSVPRMNISRGVVSILSSFPLSDPIEFFDVQFPLFVLILLTFSSFSLNSFHPQEAGNEQRL